MIRKIFAFLALVGLAAAPTWAATNGSSIAGGEGNYADKVFTVSKPTYIALSKNDDNNRNTTGWYAGLTITWASKAQKATGTTAAVATTQGLHDVSSFDVYKNTQWKAGAGSGLKCEGSVGGTFDWTMYLTSCTWYTYITAEDAYALNGADYEATLTVAGETFKIVIPATVYNAGLKDSDNVQWFPAVALIGSKVYGDFDVALKAAEAGQTVTLVADDKVGGEITVPMNVTLALGEHGAAGASYTLDADDDNLGAKLTSEKDETVTAPVGFKAIKDGDSFTWTVTLGHQHRWGEFKAAGNVFTATCTNEESDCTIEGRELAVTLTAEDQAYTGSNPTVSLEGADDLKARLEKDNHTVAFGTISYIRPAYSSTKWYAGDYTAVVTVTVDSVNYELKKNFKILPTSYSNGYALTINGVAVRFDTYTEALTYAQDGDTVTCYADISGTDLDFKTDKDVTLDLNGKTLTGGDTMTIKNTGSGTVTLTGGTFKQPKGISAKQVTISEGKFVFADLTLNNNATDEDNFFTVTVADAASLQILSGTYLAGFTGKNVVIQGGKFWDGAYTSWGQTYYKFSAPVVEEGYIVIPCKETMRDAVYTERNLVWAVIPHTHNIAYSAAENVITATCDAADHEFCGFGSPTLTVTAEDRLETGAPYDGTNLAATAGFPMSEIKVEFWKKDGQAALPGAPSELGQYEVRVMAGTATAVAPFKITHVHTFVCTADDAADTISVTCTKGSCEFKEPTTATLKATSPMFTGAAYTGAAATPGEGFPTEAEGLTLALEYWKGGEKLEGAPTDAGTYTVKMVATASDDCGGSTATVSKEFIIAQAELGAVTLMLSETEFDFDGTAKSVSVKSATYNGKTLTEGVDFVVDPSSVTSAIGSGVNDDTFTVKITAVEGGNFTGDKDATWKIIAPKATPDFNFGIGTSGGEYGAVDPDTRTLTVSAPTKLAFDDASDTWSMAMTVTLPNGDLGFRYIPTTMLDFKFPDSDAILVASDTTACRARGLTFATQIASPTRVNSFTWTEKVSVADVAAAIENGDKKLVRTVKVWSPKWSSGLYSNYDGLPVTEYKMEIPLEDLVLALPANNSLAAGDTVIEGFQLELGRGATVTANSSLADYDEKLLVAAAAGDCSITESGDGPYAYACALNQYSITYGYTGNDGKDPTNPNRPSYTAEDAFAFQPATLEGYKFLEWTTNGVPVTAIVKGTKGDLVVTGAFELVIATVNGTDQYGSLSNALEAAAKDYAETKTNTVTLVQEIDAAPYVIGKNVKLEIGDFGLGSSYTLKGGATLTANAEPAGVVAAKGSTLKKEGEGPYTYTTYAVHDHLYGDYAADGAVLTAVCTNLENIATGEKCAESCTIELKVTQPKAYDGKAPATSVDDQFDGLVTDDYTVGKVAIIRPVYSQDKWYTGDYTAIVTVTVENVAYELRKGFTIGKPAAGYTDGYEVGNTATSVRYDSWTEALAAANAGDTIYARSTFSGTTLDFSSDKDITVDLCGKTITHTSNADLTLKNTGSGTVTFVNGTIKQTRYGSSYKSVILSGGKFVFGERMFIQNVGTSDSNYLKVNANGAALTVSGGTNQCNLAASNGGTVSVTGGDFAKDPSDYIAEGYARGQQQIEGYPYHVIEHEHAFVYTGNGNVITVNCEGEPNTEYCYYNDDGNAITLTLNAEDVKEDGKQHGATLDINGDFPEEVTDADIEYWQGKTKLDGAPSAIGEYEARITVGSETAVKAFKILDRARAFDTAAISVVGALDAGRCVIAGTTLTVTNGGWKYYSADAAPDGSGIEGWYVGMTVTWPNEEFNLLGYNFTAPEFAKFTVDGTEYTGEEKIPGVKVETAGFKLFSLDLNQISTFTWYERITVADVKAADKAGQDTIEREVAAKGEKWEKTTTLGRSYGDTDGVAETTFKIVADLRGLELFDGDNYKVWPEHEHEWSYVANDHSVTATCAIAGCSYQAEPVGVEILPETVTERLCSGYPLAAKLVNAATFVGATDATVGEILYTGTDYAGKHYESNEAPVQPGKYQAEATVTLADGTTTYTLGLALTIREGLVVVDGQHYESPAEVLEMPGSDVVKVSVWKDFTAEKTYVMPANGTKVLDLCGKTISAPDGQENVITNLGALTIIDSAVTAKEAEGGTYKGKIYGNIVNKGTLTITGGYFDGTIIDESGKLNAIQISGGVFKVKPEDLWLADGCKVITRLGSSLYYVQGHVHQYFLIRSLGGSLVFATCYNILIDGTLKPSECDAREVIFLLSPMKGLLAGAVSVPTTSLEYNGLPQGVELTAFNLWALKDLNPLSDLGKTWELIQKVIEIVSSTEGTSGENIVTLLTEILEALAERGFDPADFILKPDAVAALTGIQASDTVYTPVGGDPLEGVPVNAGRYRATLTLTDAEGKSQTITSTYTIEPMPIADANPTITCDPANKTFQYNENGHTIGVTSVTLDSPAGVQLKKLQTAVQAFLAKPSIDGAMDILSQLSDAAGNIPKAPDFWNDYGILKIGDFLKDFTTYLTVELKEYLEHELEKDTLVEGVDYTVGGVTEATEIGTYELTVDGMGNYKGSIPVEWFIIYDHDGKGHNWKFDLDGAMLTATCQTDKDCLISPVAVELVPDTEAEKEYDGLPLTASLSNDAEFAAYTEATVGEVVYVDATGAQLESAPVYTGVYTAEVAIVAGSTYTLKLPLTIKKPAEGYDDGFEVEEVRYNTLAEALAVVKDGGTILCHGDLFAKTIDFTTDKVVTIDLCGQTIKPNPSRFISTGQDLTIKNDGAGKVTFVNGTIEQPRHYIVGIPIADQMSIASGNFVFGKDLTLVNVATGEKNYFTVTVAEGASLEVMDGKFDAKFAGDVTIIGGMFASDPSAFLAEGYIAVKDEGVWIVLNHTHDYVCWVLDEHTITNECRGTGSDPCPVPGGSATLSIAAETEFNNEPVRATVTTVGLIGTTLTYFEGAEELPDAPKYVGEYAVVMSAGEVAVTNGFKIMKPASGYVDGFEVGGVRYDTLNEALDAAEEGDTIYAHEDINAAIIDFTTDKNITVDLCEGALTYERSQAAASDLAIRNDGTGVVMLVNCTIPQPKGQRRQTIFSSWQDVYYDVNVIGPFVFGEGMETEKRGTAFTVTADELKITSGIYESEFVGKLEITGGTFASDPSVFLAEGCIAVKDDDWYLVIDMDDATVDVDRAGELTPTEVDAKDVLEEVKKSDGDYAQIRLTMTAIDEMSGEEAQEALAEAAKIMAVLPEEDEVKFVGITLEKRSAQTGGEWIDIGEENEAYVLIRIPIVTGGRDNWVVSRVHKGVVQSIARKMPGATGEWFDIGIGEIVLRLKKFSLYAIAWSERSRPDLSRLYPNGDGGVFVPAAKSSEQFLGTIIGEAGVEGTITVKMTKPNKNTGLFTLSATVKTLVDKQTYSFKAKKVQSAVNGPLTLTLEGSNSKSKIHTLVVTLEGNSLTGSFDGAEIDGAKYVKKSAAVAPFVGTWTGALADVGKMVMFSVKLAGSGAAKVKVLMPDGKTLSCSAKAEVGADGVVAVPATVWRSVKGQKESFGFRVMFCQDGAQSVCEATYVSPIRDWTKSTGGIVVVAEPAFLVADRMTVTSAEFKTFDVTVDPALTEKLGPFTKKSLKLSTSTGFISGTLKWDRVKGKVYGAVIGDIGLGTISVKQNGVAETYGIEVNR